MSERKVLNKYYPPDFDPTKLPKLKREKNRQFVIRIMAPFSMRCKTCGEYIYKGRKFNSRMETVENETYLGLRIYRFYVRCPKCISEITFKTDPENTDYLMEHGATRNFQAYRKLEEQIEREKKSKEEEEANNPMKALENRTKDSKREMESIEKLEELKDLNLRLASIDHDKLIADHLKVEDDWLAQQEAEDEELVRKIFGSSASDPDGYVRRILDDQSSGSSDEEKAGKSSASLGEKGNKRAATDAIGEEASVALPAVRPGFSKTKLINPVKDISVMIKPRTVARLDQTETSTIHEGSAKPVTPDSKDLHLQSVPSSSSVNTSSADNEQDYVEDRPVFKIALKKPKIDDSSNIKGNSLSLLGGYDSGNSDDSLG